MTVETDPEATSTRISITTKIPHRPEASKSDYRRMIAERLYNSEKLRQLLTRAGFCLVKVHFDLITGSARNQDLGMMARRIVLTSSKK